MENSVTQWSDLQNCNDDNLHISVDPYKRAKARARTTIEATLRHVPAGSVCGLVLCNPPFSVMTSRPFSQGVAHALQPHGFLHHPVNRPQMPGSRSVQVFKNLRKHLKQAGVNNVAFNR